VTFPDKASSLFDRPILLVSSPRAGSTLLFETLQNVPGRFTPGGESHGRIERIPGLFPPERGRDSNRLTEFDATDEVVEQLGADFYADARDRSGKAAGGRVRFLEKTPKNALRIPFFTAAWPECHFIYLYRDPRPTMASMMEAWQSGRFRTYPKLPGWKGHPWSLLLVPGWRDLIGLPLHEVVAHQWAITTSTMIGDLRKLPRSRVHIIDHSRLIDDPQATVTQLCASLDLHWDGALKNRLPLSKTVVSPPRADKWKAVGPLIDRALPIIAEADRDARAFLAEHGD
jgi:hypothetical protein